ncbi:MAG: secondary thiamine-phosphate synthase enzyme YjbQ [bacterium]
MIKEISVTSGRRAEFVEITGEVAKAVSSSGIKEGTALVYVPHTTAGVTINENADPSVKSDIIKELDKIVPWNDNYGHSEGNAAAHIKASLIGESVSVIISKGRPALGTWQGIFFCEFDGPRKRKVFIKIQENK